MAATFNHGLTLLLLITAAASAASGAYYCLEDYKPIGTVIKRFKVGSSRQSQFGSCLNTTSGQVARRCAAACDAAPSCSGFRSVGPEVRGGGVCELLTNSTAALPETLAPGPSTNWPRVNANVTAEDRIALRSISWMCWREQKDWDSFGEATYQFITSGPLYGNKNGPTPHKDWCAFGVDVAGTNLRRDTINITDAAQCDAICKTNATGCNFWIFVASRPEQALFQPARNCFAKADAFRGQNGWTGKPKSDLWIADSQVTCFSSLQDWRHLGLVLSPSVKTIKFSGSFFTVYPERVTWTEAARTCQQLPNGKLAILGSQGLLEAVSRDLLDTLPFQTAVRSAWVGAKGSNTAYSPDAPNITLLTAGVTGSDLSAQTLTPQTQLTPGNATESTLMWVDGVPVVHGVLRRPASLVQLWTAHDVVWSQQYVPQSAHDVCGRVIIQLPPSMGHVDPTSVLPGVWYYDCNKPAAFICQSSSAPTEPMSGREVIPGLIEMAAASFEGGNQQAWKAALAVILPVLAVALLACQLLHVSSRKMSRLPELIRQQRRRALGPPRTGRMSVVVTDIQGFTQLMQAAPEETTQALLLHNSIIRHAVYDNVGWVVEQEGDSFTVVFHDAEDAVAFTLQVQQALLQPTWPPGLAYCDGWDRDEGARDCSAPSLCRQLVGSFAADTSAPDTQVGAAAAMDPAAAHTHLVPVGGGHQDGAAAATVSIPTTQANVRSPGPGQCAQQGLLQGYTAGAGPEHPPSTQSPGSLLQGLQRAESSTSSGSGSSLPLAACIGGSCPPEQSGKVLPYLRSTTWSRAQSLSAALSDGSGLRHWDHGRLTATKQSAAGSSHSLTNSFMEGRSTRRSLLLGGKSRHVWPFQQLLSPRQDQQRLFNGLRVRMGCVTGTVERGQELKSSNLYRMAQDVSGAAQGGQVLLDELSFSSVKEGMWRLGAVGPQGMDFDALSASKPGQSSRALGPGACHVSRRCLQVACWTGRMPDCVDLRSDMGINSGGSLSPTHAGCNPAVVLDMGCFEVQPQYGAAACDALASTSSTTKVASCMSLWGNDLGERLVQQYQQYVQQQLTQHGRLGAEEYLGSSYDEEAPYMVSAPPKVHQQQVRGSAARCVSSHTSSSSSSRSCSSVMAGESGSFMSQLQPEQQQQQQPHAMVSPLGCASVPPSWQLMALGLLGIGAFPPSLSGTTSDTGSNHSQQLGDRPATPVPAVSSCSTCHVSSRTVRLYQVVAPSLAGRAALFGPELSVPSHWRLLDPSFFAAPGLCALCTQSTAADSWDTARATPAEAVQQQDGCKGALCQQQHTAQQQYLPCQADTPSNDLQHAHSLQDQTGPRHLQTTALQAADAGRCHPQHANTSMCPTMPQEVIPGTAQQGSKEHDPALKTATPPHTDHCSCVWEQPSIQDPTSSSQAISPQPSTVQAAMPPPPPLSPRSPQSPGTVLALRTTSLQLTRSPSVLLTSGASIRGGLGGSLVSRRPPALSALQGPTCGLFPRVTVMFAAVEAAAELLRHPTLARPVHNMLHRLILQLLRGFPGSYLVRSQQGDLRYMLAFTDPATAVKWGLTLQEASLYLPYPQEVLGLTSCGVQLDASGRLVFRGPRFKMGFSEGHPIIMPDHMGRADYHGSFVNLAARYASVAAQGGQLVTDAELARTVLALWRWDQSTPSSHAAVSRNIAMPSAAASIPGAPCSHHSPMPTTNGPCQWEAHTKNHSDQSSVMSVPSRVEGAGISPAAAAAEATSSMADVAVECSFLGSFLFKGSPSPECMVSFTPGVLSGRQYTPAGPASHKGVRLLQQVGVMDKLLLQLPAVVEGCGP